MKRKVIHIQSKLDKEDESYNGIKKEWYYMRGFSYRSMLVPENRLASDVIDVEQYYNTLMEDINNE